MKHRLSLMLFGWGTIILVILTILAILLIRSHVITFLLGLVVPLQIVVWSLVGGVVLSIIGGVAWVWSFAGVKVIDVIERKYNLGLLRLAEGEALYDRRALLHPVTARNPRSVSDKVTVNEVATSQTMLPAPLPPKAPRFSEMQQEIRDGQFPLVYDMQGQPVWGTVEDLLSVANVGNPGYGKSTTLRYIVAVATKCGAQILGWDPHGSIVKTLRAQLNVITRPEQIVVSAQQLTDELDARLDMFEQDPVYSPKVVIVDELRALIMRFKRDATSRSILVNAINRVIMEGRKVQLFMIIGSQDLPAELFDGSGARNALSSKYVFFIEPTQANMVGVDKKEYEQFVAPLEHAPAGTTYFKCPRRRVRTLGSVPETTEEDLRRLLDTDSFAPVDSFEGGDQANSDPVKYESSVHEFWLTLTTRSQEHVIEKWRAYQDYEDWCNLTQNVSVGDSMFTRITKANLTEFGLREGNPTGHRQDGSIGQVASYIGRCYIGDPEEIAVTNESSNEFLG